MLLVVTATDAYVHGVYIMSYAHTQEYGTDSLLSSAMSAWQGPSLMVYNDATFTDRDFHNLARIGQASKLDKLSTTGMLHATYFYTTQNTCMRHLVVCCFVTMVSILYYSVASCNTVLSALVRTASDVNCVIISYNTFI
jgi:hypothetical protein